MMGLVVVVGFFGVSVCGAQLVFLRRYNLMPAIGAVAAFTVMLGCFGYLLELVAFYESVGGMVPADRPLHMAGHHGVSCLITALLAASVMVVLGTIAAQLRARSSANV